MRHGRFLLVVGVAVVSFAQRPRDAPAGEYAWKNVVYLGGAPGIRVDRRDLQQTLILTPSSLIVRVEPPPDEGGRARPNAAPRVLLEISRDSMFAITYEGFRHDMHSAQAWIGIRGHWPKATDHLIVIDYRLPGGGEAEVLLRVDKKYFQEILDVLQKITADRGTPTPAGRSPL